MTRTARFLTTTLGALGLSLAATTAFAHGGGSHGSMGGFEQGIALTGPQTGLTGAGKVQALTGRDSDRDRRDRRELAERQQRIQKEITRLEEEKVQLIRGLGPLDHFRSVEALERAKRDILQIDEKIGRLQGEESGATLTSAR